MLCVCFYMYLKLWKSQEIVIVCIRLCILYFRCFRSTISSFVCAHWVRFLSFWCKFSLARSHAQLILDSVYVRIARALVHTSNTNVRCGSHLVVLFHQPYDCIRAISFADFVLCVSRWNYFESLPRCSSARSSVEFETLFESEVLCCVPFVRFGCVFLLYFWTQKKKRKEKKTERNFSFNVCSANGLEAQSAILSVYWIKKFRLTIGSIWKFEFWCWRSH